ncbi:unnamed protein product [Trichogramma brassicae]|uniref:Uncharacterized protein n=1 Tax=Trichogramma brassicae TaxID=86971 RepID=A0A6H5J2Y3_9HYME|nr:unnamed protein product [Trichogramma brassicae]
MATDERKVVGYTINEEIPVVTLLKVAIELGEITDMRTTYHPEYHSKTVEIYYFPHTYWTPAQEPITQVPSTTVSNPNTISPDKPINTNYTDKPVNCTEQPSSFGTARGRCSQGKKVGPIQRGEIRHAKGQTIPAPFRNLPKWFHCIYCGHQATSFRRRDHDAICARQMAVEEESYWKGPELKANSIINFKTHYFCGRGIDRTAWADHIKVCNIRNFSREIPKQVTCRERSNKSSKRYIDPP